MKAERIDHPGTRWIACLFVAVLVPLQAMADILSYGGSLEDVPFESAGVVAISPDGRHVYATRTWRSWNGTQAPAV